MLADMGRETVYPFDKCTLPAASRQEEQSMPTSEMAAVNIRLNPLGAVVLGMIVVCLGLYAFDVPNRLSSSAMKEEVSMRNILSVAIDLAQKGGDQVRQVRQGDEASFGQKEKGETKEGAKEYLTQGDLRSHRSMYYGFKKAFPSLKVVSEEHDETKVDMRGIPNPVLSSIETVKLADEMVPIGDLTVWIDPLDATQEYTESLLQYVTTMTCVAVKGVPVIGVIHLPFGDGQAGSKPETYWGWAGQGYSSNLHPEVHKHAEGDPMSIIVSRSHTGDVGDVAKKALGENTNIVPAGGAGYKTLQVIKGVNDAYVHTTAIKKWDICAGNAILRATNGDMTTLKGDTIDYHATGNPKNEDGLLAALANHKHLLDTLKPAFAARAKRDISPKMAPLQQ